MATTPVAGRNRRKWRKEEVVGLAVALALHAGLVAVILIKPATPTKPSEPKPVEVTISTDIAQTSTSPDPKAQAAPDVAPAIGEEAADAAPAEPVPAPPVPTPPQPQREPTPRPVPKPVEKPQPKPAPKPVPKPAPKPAPKPVERPRPQPKPVEKPKPQPKAQAKPAPKPAPRHEEKAPSKPATKPAAKPGKGEAETKGAAKTPPKKAGGSMVGADFLKGIEGAKDPQGKGAPAAAMSPQIAASLGASIRRQIKPHWQAPQGADADQLSTRIRFRLNPDGTLNGAPQVVSTTGVTASNKAQVERHQEMAVRAVRLAAPFNLPSDYYSAWKTITTDFDRKLSQ